MRRNGVEAIDVIDAISIHAPVKGATDEKATLGCLDAVISIHAPVKGATFTAAAGVHPNQKFQSTHP